jgi:hypothetical protein
MPDIDPKHDLPRPPLTGEPPLIVPRVDLARTRDALPHARQHHRTVAAKLAFFRMYSGY